ncbi:hypothetical protein EUGRSUZ_L02957 [Eucalyptus grandis]|uniref:Uncharacterized protein n=1 Tax=Eucalyptus grandis TaxID=71139 RepID=A0AAD9T8Z4_EUCGR|nr:hypothetical protein EUGRSUZ_L02957 [Eucalyptus grandis]
MESDWSCFEGSAGPAPAPEPEPEPAAAVERMLFSSSHVFWAMAACEAKASMENEVRSSYKGPLEMDALEEVLPKRRGMSKSFMSLADASASSSVKEIVKPENAYSRRCRNIFASSYMLDRSRNFSLRSNMVGISKRRPLTSSNSALVLKVAAMCNSESFCSASEDSSTSSASRSPPQLPPLHPHRKGSHNQIASPQQNFSSWQSYSLADLQQCSSPSSPVLSDSMTEKADPDDLA